MIPYHQTIRRRFLLSSCIFVLRCQSFRCLSALAPKRSSFILHRDLYFTPGDRTPRFSSNRVMVSSSTSAFSAGNHDNMHATSMSSMVSSDSTEMKQKAKLVSASLQSLAECGSRLKSGHLVSFPTETVYGLGCHALDPIAVQRVFHAKQRPLSDPLIVHVIKAEQALELWDASSKGPAGSHCDQAQQLEKQVLEVLTTAFFPGPLTIVARANPSVPQIVMANTGYVACRSPSHPIARALISSAECPIAAPSANKFGHVSPTLAAHVMDDLGNEDVWIVDPSLDGSEETGECSHDGSGSGKTVCQVGVESTVAKVQIYPSPSTTNEGGKSFGCISILRHGAISSNSIREALKKACIDEYFDVKDGVQYTPENVNNVAPGQTVKHYSPHVPCFMVSVARQQSSFDQLSKEEMKTLSQSVIIDFAAKLSRYQKYALAYCDLSPSGDAQRAATLVFETLRWTENVKGATHVFVPDMSGEVSDEGEEEALVLAVKDKLTRAASGVVVASFQ